MWLKRQWYKGRCWRQRRRNFIQEIHSSLNASSYGVVMWLYGHIVIFYWNYEVRSPQLDGVEVRRRVGYRKEVDILT